MVCQYWRIWSEIYARKTWIWSSCAKFNEAKNKAKSKWLNGCKKKHKDDITSLSNLCTYDDCKIIKKIDNWEIDLKKEKNCDEDTYSPDWYGYKRMDMI